VDKYDRRIASLLEDDPDDDELTARIHADWIRGSSLFAFVRGTYADCYTKGCDGNPCGCMTQIKLEPSKYDAPTRELKEAILADDRIPNDPMSITRELLPVFAEWQRRIDKELNRV
jgi:hypothetical protein